MNRKAYMIAAAGVVSTLVAVSLRSRTARDVFRGKVVLVTGSSRGLGLALAEEFARRGARLVLTARNPYELERAEQILSRGLCLDEGSILSVPCDLTDEGQTAAMIAAATQRFGRIDVLVNNAGIISIGPIEDQPLSAYKEAVDVNYYAALHTTLAVLPDMLRRRSGTIINIASIGGKVAIPHLLPYSASKFALVGFSQGLHAEVRSRGIKVTTVCPGLMRTGSHLHAQVSGDRQKEYRWFSLGASLPGVSISARAAARKIVDAAAVGRTELTITPQAVVAAKLAQLAPGTAAAVLSLVNAVLLPSPVPNAKEALPGSEVREDELKPLTALGESAAYEFNQR